MAPPNQSSSHAGRAGVADRLSVMAETNDRPLAVARGGEQAAGPGLTATGWPSARERAGRSKSPRIPSIRPCRMRLRRRRISRTSRLLGTRHHRLAQPARGELAAETRRLAAKISTPRRRASGATTKSGEPVTSTGSSPAARLPPSISIALRIQNALHQHPLAIFLAQLPQAVARDAFEDLEQRHVEQPAVLALGHVKPRQAQRERRQVSRRVRSIRPGWPA